MSSGDVRGCGNAGPPKNTGFLWIMSSGRVEQVLYWFCFKFPPTLGTLLNRICKLPMVLIWRPYQGEWDSAHSVQQLPQAPREALRNRIQSVVGLTCSTQLRFFRKFRSTSIPNSSHVHITCYHQPPMSESTLTMFLTKVVELDRPLAHPMDTNIEHSHFKGDQYSSILSIGSCRFGECVPTELIRYGRALWQCF